MKTMQRLVAGVLMIGAGVGLACADTQPSNEASSAKSSNVAQAIEQLERDWARALTAGDLDKVGQIVADDWTGINNDGSTSTKQSLLAAVKAGQDRAETIEIGPMEVKVLGSVAVVQGSDIEKSVVAGKDSSGKWVWMDVFVKREGKWVAIRSQSALLK
jgi:ketosteroid isomerase-like protein